MRDLQPVSTLSDEIERALAVLPVRNVPALRTLRRRFSRRIAGEPAREVLALARRFVNAGGIERRFIAYELVAHHPAASGSLRRSNLEELARGMSSWGAVDCFACYLAGPAWREGRLTDETVHSWARSPDRWWRRAAAVSTVPLNNRTRGGTGDARRTLAVCRILAADRDDMVVKAVSWALRELAKRDAAAVRSFLRRHGSTLSARIMREVRNKLDTGRKNPRRHG